MEAPMNPNLRAAGKPYGPTARVVFSVAAIGFLTYCLIKYGRQIPPFDAARNLPVLAAGLAAFVVLRLYLAWLWRCVMISVGVLLPPGKALLIHTRGMLA